jgi:uncharacterized phage protein (TIGR01671 family)
MKDVKFRFVNRIKQTGEIRFIYTSINELEMEDSWQGPVNYERLSIDLCTSLKDKNGKEIYEGDIKLWKFDHFIRYYVAIWSDFDCGFKWSLVKHNNTQERDNQDIPFDTEEEYYNYVINVNQRDHFSFDQFSEIVGNIYENPELTN